MRNKVFLKEKLTNMLMKHGNKRVSEKIVNKGLKLVQKADKKNQANLMKQVLVRISYPFKIQDRVLKKGRKKSRIQVPTFHFDARLRYASSLKLLAKKILEKHSENSSITLSNKILSVIKKEGTIIDAKTRLQENLSLNKRYLFHFRW